MPPKVLAQLLKLLYISLKRPWSPLSTFYNFLKTPETPLELFGTPLKIIFNVPGNFLNATKVPLNAPETFESHLELLNWNHLKIPMKPHESPETSKIKKKVLL